MARAAKPRVTSRRAQRAGERSGTRFLVPDISPARCARRLVTRGFAARATSFITTKMRACSQANFYIAHTQMHLLCQSNFVLFHSLSGAPNDGFLPNALKRCFRLSGVLLKLCRLILGCAIKFLSGSLPEFIRAFLSISRKP